MDSARGDGSPKDKIPARLENVDHADVTGKRRKDSPRQKSEKRTLFASQTEEASESLRYPESEGSVSEDSVTQERTEQSMAKGCIEIVADKDALEFQEFQ
jgi:hypothetical protein